MSVFEDIGFLKIISSYRGWVISLQALGRHQENQKCVYCLNVFKRLEANNVNYLTKHIVIMYSFKEIIIF